MEDLASYDRAKEIKQRISALENEEEVLATEWAEFERHKFLAEQFIRVRVRLLESKVIETLNVPGLSVKLFQEQVNGGLREVCSLTYQGIAFDAGLNYGARVFVGMMLIQSLQAYYGYRLPIMLDNAESLTWVSPQHDTQVIKLVADAEADSLTVIV
jgi:hypothetical protein